MNGATTVLEPPRAALPRPAPPARPLARVAWALGPFAALGCYGALRWGTMLNPDPVPRLLGMVALALAVASLGMLPVGRVPALAAIAALIGLLVIIPLSGLPLEWVLDLRIAVVLRAIGQGLSGLPAVFVPYGGINEPVRAVITMGAGVLLLDAALMLAFAPRSLGELRPAVAALPLVVLAVVPSALARPAVPFVHGLLLFVLLAVLVWGDRIRDAAPSARAAAVATVLLAAVGAGLAAPALDPHRPWLNFRELAGKLGPGRGENFNWAQDYGPLRWPRTGREVLQVQARRPAYWKAENLETFDGFGWTAGAVQYGYVGLDRAALTQWTEPLHVTVTGMSSEQVIAAGVAEAPTHLGSVPVPGSSTGTWTASTPLHPGDSYLVSAYTPDPSPAQLRAAGQLYPSALPTGYLSIELPATNLLPTPGTAVVVDFAPFHAGQPFDAFGNGGPSSTTASIAASPYAAAFRLARRLAAGAQTPYDYALAIKHYLARGYVYDENPPPSRYPIASFLFASRRGYCQQFAGAMALLLRMGGVPARVSAGFTTGSYNNSSHAWSVSDLDAHAWVEAWFPGYGWVTFDPTPSADPALGGHIPLPAASRGSDKPVPVPKPVRRPEPRTAAAGLAASVRAHRGSSLSPWAAALIVIALAAAAAAARVLLLARVAARDPITELERAFARSGRPLAPHTTLAGLERRFRDKPAAAGYIRAVRLSRYGGEPVSPPADGRRALRAQLAYGRGVFGRLRALWALPPLPGSARPR